MEDTVKIRKRCNIGYQFWGSIALVTNNELIRTRTNSMISRAEFV
jgi:hypothetical protein